MLVTELLESVENRRRETLAILDEASQSAHGQFFTPRRAADLIASMPRLPEVGTVKILDAGAGVASLSAALVARIIQQAPYLEVSLTCIEIDNILWSCLQQSLAEIEETARHAGVAIETGLVTADFVDALSPVADDYDIVIMNPPYAKLGSASRHRAVMSQSGVNTPNIYAAFMARGIMSLKPGGQLTAITPRSYVNGVYFEPFRTWLLNTVAIDRIHVFDSRSTVFADAGVLQENVIVSTSRSGRQDKVKLSVSTGHEDEVALKLCPYDDIVNPADPRRFIRIPVDGEDDDLVKRMIGLATSLDDLGVKIGTGRVVDFRAREFLSPTATSGSPMVYPTNVRAGQVDHPKGRFKPQWFNPITAEDTKWLVPAGTYVVIKRFSSKEERRRVVAGIWDIPRNGDSMVAFDNKLNYIHARGAGLDDRLARGLCLWLNSTPVDKFFRTFSGHTQVNATDLREMRYPTAIQLTEIGAHLKNTLPSQDAIDQVVIGVLGWRAWISA